MSGNAKIRWFLPALIVIAIFFIATISESVEFPDKYPIPDDEDIIRARVLNQLDVSLRLCWAEIGWQKNVEGSDKCEEIENELEAAKIDAITANPYAVNKDRHRQDEQEEVQESLREERRENAKTNQEMQAYKYEQQRKQQEFNQGMKQFNENFKQFNQEQQRRNTTNAFGYKPPTLGSNSNTSSGYNSSFGNTYEYDLNNPSDRARYRADPKAKLRDRLNINPRRRIERNIGQYGSGILGNDYTPGQLWRK